MPAARTRRRNDLLVAIRRAGLPAAALILMGFFGYYAILGPNGILSYRDYSRQLDQRRAAFDRLDRQRAELRNRVAQLDPRRANPDMVDELVRKKLNVVHPDELIIPLD